MIINIYLLSQYKAGIDCPLSRNSVPYDDGKNKLNIISVFVDVDLWRIRNRLPLFCVTDIFDMTCSCWVSSWTDVVDDDVMDVVANCCARWWIAEIPFFDGWLRKPWATCTPSSKENANATRREFICWTSIIIILMGWNREENEMRGAGVS